MQLTGLTLFTLASLVAATPLDITARAGFQGFALQARASTTPIQNLFLTASKGNIAVNGDQTDAVCNKPTKNAFFGLKDGVLFLVTPSATLMQELWVDDSNIGQGMIGYTTKSQKPPANSKRAGWAVDKDGHLVFNGISPRACPPHKGNEKVGWSLWITASTVSPGRRQECVDVKLAVMEGGVIPCKYSFAPIPFS